MCEYFFESVIWILHSHNKTTSKRECMYIDFSAFTMILNYYKYTADYINIKQFFPEITQKILLEFSV